MNARTQWATPRRGSLGPVGAGRVVSPLTLAVAAALVPTLVWVVRTFLFGDDYRFVSDQALIELGAHDAFDRPVLVGPYSRFGWNHPGPLLFYLLAPPYRLAGSSAAALGLGAFLCNAGALVALAVVVRRRSGILAATLVTLAAALVLRTGGTGFAADPWNPHVAVLPFMLFVVVAWEMAAGSRWAVPVAAALGSFLVQTHVGYLPIVGALTAWGLLGFATALRARRATHSRPGLRRTSVATAIVVALAWLPTVVEQATHDPGNLSELAAFATSDQERAGVAQALEVTAMHFGGRTEALFGRHDTVVMTGTVDLSGPVAVPWLLGALVAATVVAARRHDDAAALLGLTVLVGVLGATVSVAGTTGPLYPYLFLFLWPLAALASAVVAWVAWSVVRGRATHAARRVTCGASTERRLKTAAVAATFAVAAALVVPAVTTDNPKRDSAVTVRGLADGVTAALADRPGPVLLRSSPDFVALWFKAGLGLELVKRGVDIRVEGVSTSGFGRHRAIEGTRPAATLLVVVDDEITHFAARTDHALVARVDPLSPGERAHATQLATRIVDASGLEESVPVELLREAQAVATSPAVGVFLVTDPAAAEPAAARASVRR